jgi:hypothetical protein
MSCLEATHVDPCRATQVDPCRNKKMCMMFVAKLLQCKLIHAVLLSLLFVFRAYLMESQESFVNQYREQSRKGCLDFSKANVEITEITQVDPCRAS